MTEAETRAVLTISLLAAFADGEKHDREREEIRRIAEGLATDGLHMPTLYQDVLLKRVSLTDAVKGLQSSESKALAFEMAVCVCDADGVQSEREKQFLQDLRRAMAMPAEAGGQFSEAAEQMARAPLAASTVAAAAPNVERLPDDVEIDKMILNAAILNGALELLPETLSTMAIIPLQMQLVYKVGRAHGFELDRGHVRDFLATAGVGLTSQYLEQAGRKLLGGLLGSIAGGLGRGIGRQAVSSGMSFASTYALGHVAKRYYAGGRQLSAQMLREAFEGVLSEGRQMQSRYLPAIQDQARNLDTAKVMQLVTGSRT